MPGITFIDEKRNRKVTYDDFKNLLFTAKGDYLVTCADGFRVFISQDEATKILIESEIETDD